MYNLNESLASEEYDKHSGDEILAVLWKEWKASRSGAFRNFGNWENFVEEDNYDRIQGIKLSGNGFGEQQIWNWWESKNGMRLSESRASEDFGNAQQKWNSLGWMGRSNVLKKVGLDNISPDTNVWELNSNDWDIISAELIDYDTESKASEYGDAIHSEDGNGWDQGGFFFGIPNMTRDDYEGTVYWKGTPVEHYDHDYFGGDGFEQDMEKDARRLAEKCKDLESRGITPTTSSILSGESKSNEAGSEDHMCAECGFVTSDNSEYLDHLNSHEE